MEKMNYIVTFTFDVQSKSLIVKDNNKRISSQYCGLLTMSTDELRNIFQTEMSLALQIYRQNFSIPQDQAN